MYVYIYTGLSIPAGNLAILTAISIQVTRYSKIYIKILYKKNILYIFCSYFQIFFYSLQN